MDKEFDDLSQLVFELFKKEKLIEGLLNFIELSKQHEINIDNHLFFIGKYQSLLWESIILQIAYLLNDEIDKNDYPEQSRMKIELDR